jgi:deoxyuridine 5'-triphosphate nucleotidohydrolase
MDLHAAVTEPVVIHYNGRVLIPTGLMVAVPPGYEMQIRARSGLALKHGIMLCNGVGTVDCDFRGEVKIILLNTSSYPFTVNRGDRIAQAVVAPVVRVTLEEVEDLDETERGDGGFGSTGS